MHEVKGHKLRPLMNRTNRSRCIYCDTIIDYRRDMGFIVYRYQKADGEWVAGVEDCSEIRYPVERMPYMEE